MAARPSYASVATGSAKSTSSKGTRRGQEKLGCKAAPANAAGAPPAATDMAPSSHTSEQQSQATSLRLLLRAVADLLPADKLRSICLQTAGNHRRRPSVLQWNAHSLRRRQADLSLHLLQSDYDVLALQEVYATGEDLRLPGYVGYSSRTSCTLQPCVATPCLNKEHPQGLPRCAVYVRAGVLQAEVDVADLTGGPLECCVIRVRLGGVDTTVASVYIRPCRPRDPSSLLQLARRLGRYFVLCGDINAHQTIWGSRRFCGRGSSVVDVVNQLGRNVLNTGAPSFVRRTSRAISTAIDVSLATEGCRYTWTPQLDTWGSDHFPIVLAPFRGKTPRTRVYATVDWSAFRKLCQQGTSTTDFLQLVADSGRAATVWCSQQPFPQGISASTLAELLADRFTARPLVQRVLPPPATGPRYLPPTCHHPEWVLEQINAFCCERIRVHELKAALGQSKRQSAPGADGITFQMLRNLQDAEQDCLLEYFNTIWSTGALPDSWVTAVVAPALKPRKPAAAPSSYRPVSLTSAACKVMEMIVLARIEWIAAQVHYFPERQTGFRRHRCTADSIADVVATLEYAKNSGDVALLVLLDVQSAFDSLPNEVIEGSLDILGITGSLRRFVSAFLAGRTLRVRVGQALSTPRVIATGVPQGSVLTPFLFNAALAGLPAALPADTRYHPQCSIYADGVALWVRGPRRCLPAVRRSLQGALDAVTTFLGSIGLTVSPAKTEALLIHPRAASRLSVHQFRICTDPLPWKQTGTYPSP
nr:uncharacterized protein LOC126526708 [Dermacentor andersoni]